MRQCILIILMLAAGGGRSVHSQDSAASAKFMLVVHGGAGALRARHFTAEQEQAFRATLDSALRRGYEVLHDGGASLDAVQTAIALLEDSPLFNAGRGAALTSASTAELDAAIMDGYNRKAGAVAGVKHIKNPIALARLVMERTPHVMLAGEGAEALAQEQGMPLIPQSYFITEERKRALRKVQQSVPVPAGSEYGTVGAVALDVHGRLAAGTSTGGLTNKRPGRIGDSPIIGAGTYADDACAVSATGIGEYFIRNVVAYDICARMRYRGDSLKTAAEEVVLRRLVEQRGDGGVIALDKHGNVAMPFNTEGMFRGRIGADGKAAIEIYK